jgi:hypothetical protein
MRAFKKIKDICVNDKTNEVYPDQITNIKQIGVKNLNIRFKIILKAKSTILLIHFKDRPAYLGKR